MNLETKKESLSINQVIARKSQDITIEGNAIIPDVKPDILKPMNTSGTVCIYKKEIMDGKIRLDGSINLYLMYLTDDENNLIRTLNTSLDFTQIVEVEEAREGMTLEDEMKIKSIECKVLNGRKVNIVVDANIILTIFSNEDMQIISEVENIQDVQVLNKTLEVNSLIGTGVTNVYAKENISIDNVDEIAEIMKVNLEVANKDIKISYNKVLAKSDLDVKIMYLTEDNRINLVTSQIPIMGFIDISNVNEENICDLNYTIKNVLIKPNNETKGIYVETQLELNCSAYEKKEINIIQDLYSPSKDLTFSKKEINAMTNKEKIKKSLRISEQVQIHKLVGHRLYDVEVNPNILSENILNDKIIYDGNIQLKFIYEVEDGSNIDIRIIEVPFNYTAEIKGLNKNSEINTEISISSQDFIIGQNGNVDCNISLEIEINTSNAVNINIIESLDVEDFNSNNENYSMVIYFVKPGDTLWNIAKKFRSTIEDISKINEIEDANKILIGQQLFIPKYSNKVLI